MASPNAHPQRPPTPAEAQTPTTVAHDRGIVRRYRERRAERKLARLLRPRKRRALAQALRHTAREATERGSCLDSTVLLRYRTATVRTDLLEIAALLEQAPDVDPAHLKEIHDLLFNARDSPLYNPDIHVSELYATLHYLRAGLIRDHVSRPPPSPRIADDRGIQPGLPDAAPGERRMQ